MNAIQPSRTATPSLGRDLLAAARYHLGGRRGLLILGAVAVAGGLASSWGWLVAAGVAPLLLSVLPCAAMCALGLCMHKMAGRPGAAPTGASDADTLATDQRQLQLDLATTAAPVVGRQAQPPSRAAADHRPPAEERDSCCAGR